MKMPSRTELQKAVKDIILNPTQTIGYLRQIGHLTNVAINSRIKDRDGLRMVDKEWDTILILDACRFDMFQRKNNLPGKLSKYRSLGSGSQEFLKENFAGNQFHDIVYVSSNPFTSELPDETFHAHIPVYETGWDKDLQTVTPETMNSEIRKAHEKYPQKRIIGHYMQPHYPFIGEKGKSISHRGYIPDEDIRNKEERPIWSRLRFNDSELSRAAVLEAYYENLDVVLEFVELLLEDIDGKVVVTSDHGNVVGERDRPIPVKTYGHPLKTYINELVEVPWLEIPYKRRRNIVADPPVETQNDIKDTKSQLKALGYM
ncbi:MULTISPECIES: hypothetical protein [Natrialbaceae]|uniref:hypothetical protein n=1 Tax=Natrialbaceae TaxID=1644061 RepID=UPI00207D6550|nr:hypothetical protein [Natronococcus sp. CG52]